MRVHDVRPKAARRRTRVARELQVLELPAPSPVEHGALDDVPARGKRLFETADEHAEVGIGGAGVHLGDEQDPHVPIG